MKSDPSQRWHNSTFTPFPEFQRSFADTHILAVQNNGVQFRGPNDDPIFQAHKEIRIMFDSGDFITMFRGDNPAGFLGCTEQVGIPWHFVGLSVLLN